MSPADQFRMFRPRGALALYAIAAAVLPVLMSLNGCGMMGSNGMMQMMSPANTVSFAFVTNSGAGSVSAFAVSASGSLSLVPGSPFTAGAGAEFMAFDPMHKLLFVSNQNANTISAFAVNTSTGMLTPVTGSPFATGARPTGIVVDPMGRFVFVSNQASSTISVFSIGTNGTLMQVSGSPFASSSPFGLAISSAGTILFANNFPDSSTSDFNTVSAFQIGSGGTLTAVPGSPFATTNSAGFGSAVGIASDPTGRFLFVADHMAQAIVPFSINGGGGLTPVSALPAPASSCSASCHNNPLRVTVHPNDQFVFSTNVEAGTLSAFRMNNGALSPIAEFPTGQHPIGVALDASGGFLFVANKADNTISGFSVNTSTGMATPLSGSPFSASLNAPTDIVVIAKQ